MTTSSSGRCAQIGFLNQEPDETFVFLPGHSQTMTFGAVIEVDGRKFPSVQDAALHLLWLLQRLSYCEPHRVGQPADGFRFREGIIEARKLLEMINYEP